MSLSAFGIEHGISKALTSVVRTPFKTSENAQILANKIGRLKPTSGRSRAFSEHGQAACRRSGWSSFPP
jgi:hypothetical protein